MILNITSETLWAGPTYLSNLLTESIALEAWRWPPEDLAATVANVDAVQIKTFPRSRRDSWMDEQVADDWQVDRSRTRSLRWVSSSSLKDQHSSLLICIGDEELMMTEHGGSCAAQQARSCKPPWTRPRRKPRATQFLRKKYLSISSRTQPSLSALVYSQLMAARR